VHRDDLRDLLIEAGREILAEEGLSRGTDKLTFKRVFDRIHAEHGLRVTNASVIGRIWDNMDEYQSDVLAEALKNDDQQAMEETLNAAAMVLDSADRSSRSGRTAAAIELCRVAGQAHIDSLIRSPKGNLYIGIRGIAISRLPEELGSPTSKSLLRAYEEFGRRWDFIFESAFEALGLRLRPGFTMRQLSIAAISLAEGCTIWDRVDPSSTRQITRRIGSDGATQEWRLFSVGIEALLWQFTEWTE
jgi:hypothetical protein